MNRWLAIACLIGMGAGWGVTNPLSKIAVSGGYQHFGIIFWQLVIGAGLLSFLSVLRGKGLPLSPQHLRFYLFIALVGTVLPNWASYTAVTHLPAGILSIGIASVPIFAFPIAILLGEDRFGVVRLGGILAGLAGVALLIGPDTSLPDPAMAVFIPLAFLGPFFYAVEGNVVAKWGTVGLDPVQVLLGASTVGAMIALPLALWFGVFIDPRPPWGIEDAAAVASSVIHIAVYTVYVWVVSRAGATFGTQVGYLVTGFGVVWAMLLLGESYSTWVWAVMGLILFGMFLVQPRSR